MKRRTCGSVIQAHRFWRLRARRRAGCHPSADSLDPRKWRGLSVCRAAPGLTVRRKPALSQGRSNLRRRARTATDGVLRAPQRQQPCRCKPRPPQCGANSQRASKSHKCNPKEKSTTYLAAEGQRPSHSVKRADCSPSKTTQAILNDPDAKLGRLEVVRLEESACSRASGC